jgi:hypothetical protein
MTTPFILGNDFSDQYSISVIRREGETYLDLGNSGRTIRVENSTSPSLLDKDGHAFQVSVYHSRYLKHHKYAAHRSAQRMRRKVRKSIRDSSVSVPKEQSFLVKLPSFYQSKLISLRTMTSFIWRRCSLMEEPWKMYMHLLTQ